MKWHPSAVELNSILLVRRFGASHEATDALYRAMCLAPYCPIGMVIAFVVDCVTFYFFVD
jgi:hypothetical protein